MKFRTRIAAMSLAALAPLALVACGTDDDESSTGGATTSMSGSTGTSNGQAAPQVTPDGRGGGPGMGVDPASVTTEEQLVALVQDAYGDASLGLHRGHQPVEDVLNEVLGISHDELHVRMEEQGQNLAAIAEDLGIDPQTLVDALVASRTPAVDDLVAAGTITQDQADAYLDALEEAFTYRVTWDGQEATPTFAGV